MQNPRTELKDQYHLHCIKEQTKQRTSAFFQPAKQFFAYFFSTHVRSVSTVTRVRPADSGPTAVFGRGYENRAS